MTDWKFVQIFSKKTSVLIFPMMSEKHLIAYKNSFLVKKCDKNSIAIPAVYPYLT